MLSFRGGDVDVGLRWLHCVDTKILDLMFFFKGTLSGKDVDDVTGF